MRISPYNYNSFIGRWILRPVNRLWWRFIPGVMIKVRWPAGTVVIDENHPNWYDVGARRVSIESADPNDHYRPELERCVGDQGWDWDWNLIDNDAGRNLLTIKFRRRHQDWATYFAVKWS